MLTTRIAEVLSKKLDLDIPEVHFATPIVDVPGCAFDSLKALEVVEVLEDHFQIQIDMGTDDIQFDFSTIERMAALVTRKIKATTL